MRYIQTVKLEHDTEVEVSAVVSECADTDFELESIKIFGVSVGAGEIPRKLYNGLMDYVKENYDPANWEKMYG